MSGTGVVHATSARRRVVSVMTPVLVGAFVLGACGGSDDGADSPTATTLTLNTTAFATIPPATTTTVPDTLPADGTSPVAQEYEIQFGDFPLGVAERFGVTLEEIAAYNEITDCTSSGCDTFPFPGTVILIPPGADIPEDTGGGSGDQIVVTGGQDDTGDAADDEEPAGDTIPEAGDNCGAGSYTIESGDIPITVAEKFDVTLDALNAANAGNSNYTSFIAGTSIVIPARDDC